jgi:hypothetical protein
MRVRTSFQLLFLALLTAGALAACGSPNGNGGALPPSAAGIARAVRGTPDPDLAIEQAVARAYQRTVGPVRYGTVDDGWYTPSPAPGKPGYLIVDGETVKAPPDDSPPAGVMPRRQGIPAPMATMNCNTFQGAVPPPCTSTGPFRRVYSAPGYSFTLANLTLPAEIKTMPTAAPGAKNPINGDTGFIYFEGWVTSNPNGGNSEFGFQYSALHNWYSVYYKTYSPKYQVIYEHYHWVPGTVVTFAIAGYAVNGQNNLHVALIGTTQETCALTPLTTPTGHLCLAHGHSPDAGWAPSSCCIMARMTTIGQTAVNAFYDGSAFGPIQWSGVELAPAAPTPAPGTTTLPLTGKEPPWSGGSAQNWPPQLNKIVVSGQSATGETDTISLSKLPALKVALAPATCQHFKTTGTVDYTAHVTGSVGNFPLQYGWPKSGYKMTVSGGTYNPSLGIYLGSSATSATVSFALGAEGGKIVPTQVFLYYTDATGRLTNRWNGATIMAQSLVSLGGLPCPTPSPKT